MWNWIAWLGPPVSVVIIAKVLKRRQADIDEVMGEPTHQAPPLSVTI